ncbi:receptor-mediated endocytosis protein 6 homolog [Bombyx mandarina]|uniref:GTPase-activating protein and VPS9 domain-containing protein 1 n=2 Tax=Bombyx TaxID=7090 RepID=A0A8R2M3E0_BOMMO|nr:receptor-mediated endocytosis protein 6 homolog [Bombyx mandarina]XP_028029738.1 receptor-mediated endocytosis protein 6 homolog [Bombyx mandarina]XP_037871684.1 receptor-mediated endocytosis protein 6 homolog isoform X2 [Bombyx mori]
MMQSSSEGCMNIAELANQLRREKIFINTERQLLQKLNEDVENRAVELLQVSWICSQQRQNLTNLISRSEVESIAACQRASALERTTFIDVYKVLKYKEALALGELLGWLRDSPHLVALCLLLGEEHMPQSLPSALVAGLYGSCRLASDRTRLLAVIKSLIKHQLVTSNDPRKLFRTGKCALASLYAVFRDGHTPARQFLIAMLQGPVMTVLQEDEFFLDIDPDKSMERFSSSDRLKKFGPPNSAEYAAKVTRYRKWTVQSLYNLTTKFIISMKEHWSNFPTTIAWIIQQIVHLLKQHSRVSDRELHALCTDLVLNHLICPAIMNPEAHGVLEVPVSYIARSNLIQIAQIIQMLCLAKYQDVDPKLRDLYMKFERTSVWTLVESVSGEEYSGAPPASPHPPLHPHPRTPRALLAPADAHLLIMFLKRISSKLNNNMPSTPSDEQPGNSATVAEAVFSSSSSECSWGGEASASRLAALLQTMEPNYRSRLHDLLKKMPDLSKYKQTSPLEAKDTLENGHPKKGILAKVPKPRLPRSGSSNSSLADERSTNGSCDREEVGDGPEVWMIRLANTEEHEYIGLIPESKVLECYYGGAEGDDPALVPPRAPQQKRTRFSVSHDEVSLGNTSDNLEAVSEAASNHSVTSSMELETEDQNDNLSDMVSANVSGRGSPNISGRETPSSQVTDGDAAGDAPQRRIPQNVPPSQAVNVQAKLLKHTRNEIEDKFCKFEIRKLLEGDETISIMSDTWSTDVLASDSETIGDSCEQTQIAAGQGVSANSTNAPDASETASESAWSMDVLASDSDRNTEVDTDDCVSVAARSDTSWPRRASQPDEPAPPPQNGNIKRPDVIRDSPRHASRPHLVNRSGGGYLTATAALSRGGELDLAAHHAHYGLENRKSILVNGYPVMTCYTASAPESPSTAAPPPPPADAFDNRPINGESTQTESTLDAESQSDATSQWVDDSFPSLGGPSTSTFEFPPASKPYEDNDLDRSNSSESSFNALSVSQYGDTITDLMTRMSSATISTSTNLMNNLTSRITKSEIRTVVSISSSKVEKKRDGNNISLSTLSVNSGETSVSDKSSSQDVNSENVTERRVSPPPVKAPSTGAIPKSISFDATAEKSQRRRAVGEDGLAGNLDELKNNVKRSGGNLLHKIKMFRHIGRSQQHHDIKLPEEDCRIDEGARPEAAPGESSEDILAKYRRKSSSDSSGKRRPQLRLADVPDADLERCEGVVNLNDPEVFNSMKQKLRMVLSNPDLHCVDYVPNRVTSSSLVEWMRAAAACAGCESGASHAHALGRALGGDAALDGRLAAALRADLCARRPYAAYLASCRAALAHAERALLAQIKLVKSECSSCGRAAAAARVLQQLERGHALRRLAAHHLRAAPLACGGELMDEKATRLTAGIKAIIAEVKADPSWEGATQNILEMAELTVERAAFARLYLHVLFPNGDGDIARDQVLSEHIRRLAACTCASRAGVAPRHLWAAPFPRAQALLRQLPGYRAPADKIACVTQCVTSIMAVLNLTECTAPSADDLTPVLVYVIIKVNPPSLLSTIELVSALGGGARGEQHYCWTHFCAAVAYIKTMDYTPPPI